jgi:hypothetical protein
MFLFYYKPFDFFFDPIAIYISTGKNCIMSRVHCANALHGRRTAQMRIRSAQNRSEKTLRTNNNIRIAITTRQHNIAHRSQRRIFARQIRVPPLLAVIAKRRVTLGTLTLNLRTIGTTGGDHCVRAVGRRTKPSVRYGD